MKEFEVWRTTKRWTRMWESFSNRNAALVDISWETFAWKELSEKIVDSVKWLADALITFDELDVTWVSYVKIKDKDMYFFYMKSMFKRYWMDHEYSDDEKLILDYMLKNAIIYESDFRLNRKKQD